MSGLIAQPITPFTANTTSLQVALAQNTLGVGFSGSGFLLLYLTGVSAVLRSLGIIRNTTKLAGASGGAITSAGICSGVPSAREYTTNLNTMAVCRAANNCRGTLDTVLRVSLASTVSLGAAQRCKDRLYVAVTQARLNTAINPTDTGLLTGPNWSNDVQLLNGLATSAYLSLLSGPTAVTYALATDGIPAAYDGYYTSAIPTPPGVTYAITVSATPPGVIASVPTSFPGAISPYLPLNPVRVASTTKPDIYPGLSGAIKFTTAQWLSFVLNVPDNATLRYIYDTGRNDAAAFAGANKLASAAAIQAALDATKATAMRKAAAAQTSTEPTIADAYGAAAVLNAAASSGSESVSTAAVAAASDLGASGSVAGANAAPVQHAAPASITTESGMAATSNAAHSDVPATAAVTAADGIVEAGSAAVGGTDA